MLVLQSKHTFHAKDYLPSISVNKRLVMTTKEERIREAINGSGNTPSSIADRLGCTPQAVNQWMSGDTKNIKNDLLFGLEDITGYSARWITTGEGRKKVFGNDAIQMAEVFERLDRRGKETVSRAALLTLNRPNRPLPQMIPAILQGPCSVVAANDERASRPRLRLAYNEEQPWECL